MLLDDLNEEIKTLVSILEKCEKESILLPMGNLRIVHSILKIWKF